MDIFGLCMSQILVEGGERFAVWKFKILNVGVRRSVYRTFFDGWIVTDDGDAICRESDVELGRIYFCGGGVVERGERIFGRPFEVPVSPVRYNFCGSDDVDLQVVGDEFFVRLDRRRSGNKRQHYGHAGQRIAKKTSPAPHEACNIYMYSHFSVLFKDHRPFGFRYDAVSVLPQQDVNGRRVVAHEIFVHIIQFFDQEEVRRVNVEIQRL